jgi:hypothetical protein
MTTCAETDCPFRTFGGWCGLTACIRRNTTTEIGANPGWVIPDDYVKVVRCRDCKHGEPTHNARGEAVIKCEEICWLCRLPRLMEPDWFCANGERRESE